MYNYKLLYDLSQIMNLFWWNCKGKSSNEQNT